MKKQLSKLGSVLWRRTAFWRSGAGVMILAVAAVGLRWWWIQMQRPAHVAENAAAYGSLRDFYGVARMNHDGSQFIYTATADDRGRALFLCDAATGNKRQILEDLDGVGAWKDDFNIQAGPWSPDDSCFLCCVSNQTMICPLDTNQPKVVIGDKMFSEAVWLSPARFAFVTDEKNLCLGQKRADGQWEQKILMSRNLPVTSLTAISPDTLAWLENGEVICRANLSEVTRGGDAASPDSSTGVAASEASPPPTNGLALWLDASKLRQLNQTPVLELADLSRNKNDAVRNGTPPVFNATNSPRALNGQGTIHFGWVNSATDGTGLKTRAPLGIAGAAPRSMFVVMRHEADRAMMVSMGDTSAHGALFAVEWSERLFLPTGWWADNYIDAASTDWNLLEVIYDGTSQKGYVNGILRGTANARLNTVQTGVEIGFRDGTDAKAAEGDFAELLVYDRALDFAERQQVEDYLRGKWFGQKPAAPQSSLVWHNPGLDGMTGFSYSQATGRLLISRTANGRDSIWRLDGASGPDTSATQIMEEPSLRGAQWAGPDQFIYVSRDANRAELMLSDLTGNERKRLAGQGNVEWFRMTADQKQLLLFGTAGSAAVAGIWRYDLASDALRPVISSSDSPSIHARAVVSSRKTLAAPGGNVTYTIFRPANFDRNKKHPLVIGDTVLNDQIYGESFMTSMAACGACVAVVERAWWADRLAQWPENVQALYEKLKDDPTVDAGQVYLFAAGDETRFLCQLVEDNPAPWRGLIVTGSGQLPDFSAAQRFQLRPKVLVCFGELLRQDDLLAEYQQDMLPQGALVEYVVSPAETMRYVGEAAKRERIEAVAHFIFEE